MQGEFCQKMPPWVYGGVQLEGASLLYIRWEFHRHLRPKSRRFAAVAVHSCAYRF